jgi:hypothetical protein
VPLPLPVAPLVIVIHAALLVAVQVHPVGDVMVAVPVPPVPGSDWLVGDAVYVHGTPTCETVSV